MGRKPWVFSSKARAFGSHQSPRARKEQSSSSCDAKCEGVTYWAIVVKDRSITQPKVILITLIKQHTREYQRVPTHSIGKPVQGYKASPDPCNKWRRRQDMGRCGRAFESHVNHAWWNRFLKKKKSEFPHIYIRTYVKNLKKINTCGFLEIGTACWSHALTRTCVVRFPWGGGGVLICCLP